MVEYSGRVIESQVDYLTCSAHGKARAGNLLDLARGLAKEEAAKGNRERRWRLMGYEGTHQGAVEYGQRDSTSTILRVSGNRAAEVLPAALSAADAVTRLDLAVTWHAQPPDPMLGKNAYALADLWYSQDKRRSRPSYVGDAAGGYTCYIGHRESESFFRIYNKQAECEATQDTEGAERYRDCWRYELESKGSIPLRLAESVLDTEDPHSYVQGYVYQWLQAHGVAPAFPHLGGQALVPGFRRRSDADAKLRHIRRNVRPTADFLRQAGRDEDLRVALGFDRTAEMLRQLQWLRDTWPDTITEASREGTPTMEGTSHVERS